MSPRGSASEAIAPDLLAKLEKAVETYGFRGAALLIGITFGLLRDVVLRGAASPETLEKLEGEWGSAATCMRCGYQWVPRTPNPGSCANKACKSTTWKAPAANPRAPRQLPAAEAPAAAEVAPPARAASTVPRVHPHALSAAELARERAESLERQRLAADRERAASAATERRIRPGAISVVPPRSNCVGDVDGEPKGAVIRNPMTRARRAQLAAACAALEGM